MFGTMRQIDIAIRMETCLVVQYIWRLANCNDNDSSPLLSSPWEVLLFRVTYRDKSNFTAIHCYSSIVVECADEWRIRSNTKRTHKGTLSKSKVTERGPCQKTFFLLTWKEDSLRKWTKLSLQAVPFDIDDYAGPLIVRPKTNWS